MARVKGKRLRGSIFRKRLNRLKVMAHHRHLDFVSVDVVADRYFLIEILPRQETVISEKNERDAATDRIHIHQYCGMRERTQPTVIHGATTTLVVTDRVVPSQRLA